MPVINNEFVNQYKLIHKNKKYGFNSIRFINLIKLIINEIRPQMILDYGCGQSLLFDLIEQETGIRCDRFDPAIEKINFIPKDKYDFIICTDVLEHIPENDLGDLLMDIKSFSTKVFFFIATRPAAEILPNGENAHCTIKESKWWIEKIKKVFGIYDLIYDEESFACAILTWKTKYRSIYEEIIYGIRYKQTKGFY